MIRTTRDEGFTLVETVVAMLVFALISSGVIAATITISRMSADDRSRIVATNLAAQQTDAIRSIGNPFGVANATTTQTVSGRTYTVTRTAAWVDASGADATCGNSTNLQYKRVTVTVTWADMAITTLPVRTDTLLASVAKTTDAARGAILIDVLDSTGVGERGVTPTVSVPSGSTGTPLSAQPAATDGDGCSYATGVLPGVYAITLNRAGSVDNHQVAAPVVTVSVSAGSTVTAPFNYDTTGTYTIGHASNASSYTTATPLLPVDMRSTLLPVGGTATTWPVLTANTATTATAWPAASGYTAVAGAATDATGVTTCASFDPSAWPAGTRNGVPLAAGTRAGGNAATAGGTANVNEKMGIVQVTATAAGTLVATSANPATASTSGTTSGNPGCSATATTLTFGSVLTSGTVTVALPYGTWTLSSSSSSALAKATPISNALTNASPVSSSGNPKTVAITLDPRSTP